MIQTMVSYLSEKLRENTEGINQLPETLDEMKNLESEYARRMRELERMEEAFNQCVALIPETDEAMKPAAE